MISYVKSAFANHSHRTSLRGINWPMSEVLLQYDVRYTYVRSVARLLGT